MSTLPLIWSAIWPTLAILAAILAMLLVALLVNLRYSLATDPERASAQDASPSPQPAAGNFFITVCSWCHTVTRIRYGAALVEADRIMLRRGDTVQVSHGICRACLPMTEKELRPAAHNGGGHAAGTQPANPRPALAGAGTI